ncbi:MAG: alpha/beta fold hydrolase [Chloroflexota bacterium]
MQTTQIAFQVEPFTPHPLLTNAHAQTLGAEYFRKLHAIPAFRRVRLDTPDGDFLDIDFAEVENHTWEMLGDDAPILYVLHGLEGDAKRGYACALYQQAAVLGYRCVGINYRSCSGEMNRTARFYHMGATGDVKFVLDWLLNTFSDVPVYMVGVSLGGNMLLKYLGEEGANVSERIKGAAAISPPFVATGEQRISDDRLGRVYGGHLLKRLQTKVRLKAEMLRETKADPYKALMAKTLREFDDAITAPLHGFADAHDYYARSNSVNFLPDIQRPTLLIRAEDDPFFNPDIPYDIIRQNPYLVEGFTAHGGHVGFIEGINPLKIGNWAQRQTLRFFEMLRDS